MNEITINILLLGDSSVGKTNLLMRYTQNKFNESHISTCGFDIVEKNINLDGRNVKLKITDPCGQGDYKKFQKNFYHGIDGIIFIFDVTNKESFVNIENWLNQAREYIDFFESVLVGNKIDLTNIIVVNKEDVKENAYYREKEYYEVSTKENIDIQKPFEELTRMIINNLEENGSIMSNGNRVSLSEINTGGSDKIRCC